MYDFTKWVDADLLKSVKAIAESTNPLPDEINICFTFANGLNVSVIRNEGSYGGRMGLFEASVFRFGGHCGKEIPVIIPDVTDPQGIAGWLDDIAVEDLLSTIAHYGE